MIELNAMNIVVLSMKSVVTQDLIHYQIDIMPLLQRWLLEMNTIIFSRYRRTRMNRHKYRTVLQ